MQNFNWHTPSWDLFIILAWGVASVFYAFAAGRGRIISLLMSLYIAKLLVYEAPWLRNAINSKLTGSLVGLQRAGQFFNNFCCLVYFSRPLRFPHFGRRPAFYFHCFFHCFFRAANRPVNKYNLNLPCQQRQNFFTANYDYFPFQLFRIYLDYFTLSIPNYSWPLHCGPNRGIKGRY